jgi:D-sedoheptulose 7-phosphate isomerase
MYRSFEEINVKTINDKLYKHIDLLICRYPTLEKIQDCIFEAYLTFEECFKKSGKLLVSGNGGSAADAEHIVGELMKGFKLPRMVDSEFAEKLIAVDSNKGKKLAVSLQGGLPAIALNSHPSLNSAFLNDVDGHLTYAQQVHGYGKEGDVFLGISTSGNSQNVLYAAVVAKAKGLKVFGFTGANPEKRTVTSHVIETYKNAKYGRYIYHKPQDIV